MWLLLCWHFTSRPNLWRDLIRNRCWILSKSFSASIEMIVWLLFFSLLMWCITMFDSCILVNPCIPGIYPYIFGYGLLIFCWWFCIYDHQGYWPVIFFFVWCLWFWYQGDGGFKEWAWICHALLCFVRVSEE